VVVWVIRLAAQPVRHTTATLLKNLGVPARDAQVILGHSRLAITLEIYTHEDRQAHREALGRIGEALGHNELPQVDEEEGEADEAYGEWVSNVGVNRSTSAVCDGVMAGAPGRTRTRDPLLKRSFHAAGQPATFLIRAGLLIFWLQLNVSGFRPVLARGWHRHALDANYWRARQLVDLGSQLVVPTTVDASGRAAPLLYFLLYGADA
jgi:hypothetical protein